MGDNDGRFAWIGLTGAKLYFAGAGCIVLGLMGCMGFCAFFLGGGYLTITRSPAYEQAVSIVQAKPEVLLAFGGSVEVGSLREWHIEGGRSSRTYKCEFVLTGPAGEGTMALDANGSYDEWRIDRLLVTKGSEHWDLTPVRPR